MISLDFSPLVLMIDFSNFPLVLFIAAMLGLLSRIIYVAARKLAERWRKPGIVDYAKIIAAVPSIIAVTILLCAAAVAGNK
ncbi:hypothetical protein [Rhizobium leguminosarum]|uniref:hypothetical protein n=1 Tax=Rhizobium TaxID=379 RepID=UPI00103C71D5|nr:hypothetical protein [Rhizobium leguminosarum]TCA72257.1 hypothetical protein E0H69_18575 [Rhizobium leguminosarum bv. viciae]